MRTKADVAVAVSPVGSRPELKVGKVVWTSHMVHTEDA